GALDVGIGRGAVEIGVEAVDRRRFGDVERLTVWHALDDVEEDDVAELLQADQVRKGATDLAGADQCDLGSCHSLSSLQGKCSRKPLRDAARVTIPINAAVQARHGSAPFCKPGQGPT